MSTGWICPECGLDYDTVSPSDAEVAARSFGRRFSELVENVPDVALLRVRPEPDVWSVLEYTAHVRDVFAWMADCLRRMVTETDPTIDFPDPDAMAAEQRYNEQDPLAVTAALRANGERLAEEIAGIDTPTLSRTAHFDWGDRDVLTMVRNAVHEGKHHLRDAEHVLVRVS